MPEHESPSKRKPPIAVPLTLIALGAAAIVAPIILLRRTRAVRDLHNAPPPIRRGSGPPLHCISPSAAEGCALPRRHVKSQPEVAYAVDLGVQPVTNRSRTGGALYALKALGIATCIVGASAVTSVFAVRWAMGVQSAEEFAAHMRSKIQSLTPLLSSRIYKNHPESAIETEGGETEEWMWAEGAERLSKAYEEGGLVQWMMVAERELELEVRNERKRRTRHEGRSIGT